MYEPTEWKTGDVITSTKLNKMESGIADASSLTVLTTEYMPDATEVEQEDTTYYIDASYKIKHNGEQITSEQFESLIKTPCAYVFNPITFNAPNSVELDTDSTLIDYILGFGNNPMRTMISTMINLSGNELKLGDVDLQDISPKIVDGFVVIEFSYVGSTYQ